MRHRSHQFFFIIYVFYSLVLVGLVKGYHMQVVHDCTLLVGLVHIHTYIHKYIHGIKGVMEKVGPNEYYFCFYLNTLIALFLWIHLINTLSFGGKSGCRLQRRKGDVFSRSTGADADPTVW